MKKEAKSDPELEFETALEMEKNQKFNKAVIHYKKAISLDPLESRYWISLGVCLSILHHWEQAINCLKRGIELKPHYCEADARMFLADALYEARRKREAREQWEIVSKMESMYPSYEEPINQAKRRLEER